jgi:uncharacterized protein
MPLHFKKFFFAFLIGWIGCCQTIDADSRISYLTAYHQGNLEGAEKALTQAISPQKRFFKKQRQPASWLLLDRAMIRFAMGKTNSSIQDYQQALDALEYYSKSLVTESIAQVLLQDNSAAFQAEDFEQVLTRLYFAFALLQKGDENNACALLRQAEEYQQNKRLFYKKNSYTQDFNLIDNGLCKYLLALLSERRGDISNASLLYQQAQTLLPCSDRHPCQSTLKSKQATVLVICHNGNVPHKVSKIAPASVASACALEFFMGANNQRVSLSTLAGIPIPTWHFPFGASPIPTYAQLNQCMIPLLPFYAVSQVADEQLKQRIPLIVARGVARVLLRRCAVNSINEKDELLGLVSDVACYFINRQTRADTRSWRTLPAFIDLARFNVEPGKQVLTLQMCEGATPDVRTFSLCLKPNDLCVIHIFNIHPGVRKILIPQHFILSQGA